MGSDSASKTTPDWSLPTGTAARHQGGPKPRSPRWPWPGRRASHEVQDGKRPGSFG